MVIIAIGADMSKLFIITLTLIIGFWSLLTPIFEFPDEQAHIGTVSFLSKEGRIPVGPELDMTIEMAETQKLLGVFRNHLGQNSYTYHPEHHVSYSETYMGLEEAQIMSLNTPDLRSSYVATEAARYPRLYYDYLHFWHDLVGESDIMVRSFAMRLAGLLFVGLTAIVLYRLGLQLFGSQLSALILTMLVLLQPMYSFLSAGVNSDNLHNLLFAVLIYLGLQITRVGLKPNLLLGSALIIALDIATKPQGYLGVIVIVLAIMTHIISTRQWHKIIWLGVIALIGFFVIFHQANPYRSWIITPNQSGSSLTDFVSFSFNKLVAQNIVWYWGVFKWLGIVLPPIYWQIANRLVVIAGIGLMVYLYRFIKKQAVVTPPPATVFLFLTSLVYALAIYYFDYQYVRTVGYSIGVQARYLFPTISAHMALLMIGILSLANSQKVQGWLLRGLGIFIIWMQLGGIWRLITSYYDVASIQLFITQASQYKPAYAKGEWWYLWISLYVLSLVYLTWTTLTKPLGHTEPRVGESAPNSGKPQKYGRKKSKGIA